MPEPKPHCPDCRYPMLKLSGYDGDCSLDAPGFNRPDPLDYPHGMREIVFLLDIFGDVRTGVRLSIRRRRVKKLRDEVLASWPQTLVCPHCLRLRKER